MCLLHNHPPTPGQRELLKCKLAMLRAFPKFSSSHLISNPEVGPKILNTLYPALSAMAPGYFSGYFSISVCSAWYISLSQPKLLILPALHMANSKETPDAQVGLGRCSFPLSQIFSTFLLWNLPCHIITQSFHPSSPNCIASWKLQAAGQPTSVY